MWDTDLLLSVITVFPRGLWLIRNFSLLIPQIGSRDAHVQCLPCRRALTPFFASKGRRRCSRTISFTRHEFLLISFCLRFLGYAFLTLTSSRSTTKSSSQTRESPPFTTTTAAEAKAGTCGPYKLSKIYYALWYDKLNAIIGQNKHSCKSLCLIIWPGISRRINIL
jgi:hypothetical protein